MHLEVLKYFCDVFRFRNFSKAAQYNKVSQSAVSQAVQQLEKELDSKLVDRSTRPLSITAKGQLCYKTFNRILDEYDSLREEIREKKDDQGLQIKVAVIYSVGLSHMNYFIDIFKQKYPAIEIKLFYLHPDQVYHYVESGQVDLGVLSFPVNSREFEVLPWKKENMLLACSPQHKFAQKKFISIQELDGLSYIAFDSGLRIRAEVDAFFAKRNVFPQVSLEFDNIESIKRAVETGAGVALLPEPTLSREIAEGRLMARVLKDATLYRPLGIIRRYGKKSSREVSDFIELLQSDSH